MSNDMTAADLMGQDVSGGRQAVDLPPSPFPLIQWKTKTKTSKVLHIGFEYEGLMIKRVERPRKKEDGSIDWQPEKFRDGTPNVTKSGRPRWKDAEGNPVPKTYDMVFVLMKPIESFVDLDGKTVELPALDEHTFYTPGGRVVYRDFFQAGKRFELGSAKREAFGEKDQYKWPTGASIKVKFRDTEDTGQGNPKWLWDIACTPAPKPTHKDFDAIAAEVFAAYNAITAYDDEVQAILSANGATDLADLVGRTDDDDAADEGAGDDVAF